MTEGEILTVVVVRQESIITVHRPGGLLWESKYLAGPVALTQKEKPLRPGDALRVVQVNPPLAPNRSTIGGAVVERVVDGIGDGCRYLIWDYLSKEQKA